MSDITFVHQLPECDDSVRVPHGHGEDCGETAGEWGYRCNVVVFYIIQWPHSYSLWVFSLCELC